MYIINNIKLSLPLFVIKFIILNSTTIRNNNNNALYNNHMNTEKGHILIEKR